MDNFVVLDCEVYPNYFLICFKNLTTGKVLSFSIKGEHNKFDDETIRRIRIVLRDRFTFGFNSVNYDMPIIMYALSGKTSEQIFNLSEEIISNNMYGWQTLQKYGIKIPQYIKHLDIQEPSPGVKVSLKLYGGRMHSKRLQDLPFEVGTLLTQEQMEEVETYCINDLDTTIDLFNTIKERIQLRLDMSEKYGPKVLSKSDAQIAEIVIKQELGEINEILGQSRAPQISKGIKYSYNIPDYISFNSPQILHALDIIRYHKFGLDDKGSIKLPKEIKDLKIKLGKSVYQLGIGGIHSNEKKQRVEADKNHLLIDRDVEAYYPRIILNLGLYPKHLGPSFLKVYKNIVDTRVKAKKEGNKVLNESLKIVINGSFGKLGSKWSALYAPDLMIQVTLTGQLALLMLIESIEEIGCSVVSANTDGFVTKIPKHLYEQYDTVCFDWELKTGFTLESTSYKALYSRDVNNYLAITDKGTKGKGIFTLNELSKNPAANISMVAVIDYLEKGISITDTIQNCKDIRQFLAVRSVTGGAVWRGQYLGRVVRWIYSKKGEAILYKKNGNKVARSDGAIPIMELCDIPDDLNYDWYITEAMDILQDIGLTI
jgi:hypothetical protein